VAIGPPVLELQHRFIIAVSLPNPCIVHLPAGYTLPSALLHFSSYTGHVHSFSKLYRVVGSPKSPLYP
jgi:hypothetical protein